MFSQKNSGDQNQPTAFGIEQKNEDALPSAIVKTRRTSRLIPFISHHQLTIGACAFFFIFAAFAANKAATEQNESLSNLSAHSDQTSQSVQLPDPYQQAFQGNDLLPRLNNPPIIEEGPDGEEVRYLVAKKQRNNRSFFDWFTAAPEQLEDPLKNPTNILQEKGKSDVK